MQKKAKKRKDENLSLKTEMCARIEEELKKVEGARQLVQNDLAAMKEEIRHIQLSSGSTVCSEASTVPSRDNRQALVLVLTISAFQGRWNSKAGSLTDYKRCYFKRTHEVSQY